MSHDRRDISGVWYGRWGAEHPEVAPSRFIAVLEERGGAVTGTTSEPDPENDERVLHAFVGGERTGNSIAWVKQYDGSGRFAHAVRYTGTVNPDATEVRGRWQLESFGGDFVMQREIFDAAELEAVEERRVPLPEL